MIHFPCQCGHQFTFPDNQAGGVVQCPDCRRLNDIPALSDLAAIAADGTYRFDAPAPGTPNRLGEMVQVFGRDKLDAQGNPKDFRNTMDDIRAAGVNEIPIAAAGNPLRVGPKYDPITGELLRPIEIAPPIASRAGIGAGSGRPIGYATPDVIHRVGPMKVLLELCMPANAVVMSFIFLFHLMAEGMMLLYLLLKFLGAGLIVIAVILMAHYGCVVEETGPNECDELPRPLRMVSFGDDIWRPFFNFALAFVLCYGPSVYYAAYHADSTAREMLILRTLQIVGTIFLPAVLLTTLTSGSIANLRPDRVWGVMAVGGRRYIMLVLTWILTAGIYGVAIAWFDGIATVQTYVFGGKVPRIYWVLAVAGLVGGIYLMHFFCWQLGLLYRAGQADFPWVMQRHIKRNNREMVAVAEAKRVAGIPTAKRYEGK